MNESILKFPQYLGYGILNPESRKSIDDKKIANYEFNGQPIMTVEQTETGASVEEYYQDKAIGRSFGKKLEGAIFQHYLNLDQLSSPLHRAWIDKLVSQGNIYAEMISKTKDRVLFYPAVFLIDIRVPVLEEKLESVKEFIKNPTIQKHLPKIEESKLITAFPNYKETLTTSILRITTPIAFTIDIAKELSSAGIIEKEKRLRAIVSVARPNAGALVRSFSGTKTDPWLFYSITLNNNL